MGSGKQLHNHNLVKSTNTTFQGTSNLSHIRGKFYHISTEHTIT